LEAVGYINQRAVNAKCLWSYGVCKEVFGIICTVQWNS